MGLREGDEMWFFSLVDDNGLEYIAMTNQVGEDYRKAIARKVLEELGLEVPAVLLDD